MAPTVFATILPLRFRSDRDDRNLGSRTRTSSRAGDGREFYSFGYDQQLGPCADNDTTLAMARTRERRRGSPSGWKDAASLVRGIQSSPIIATVKHFDCNGKEDGRGSINVTISERNLMEHFGLAFRTAVQEEAHVDDERL